MVFQLPASECQQQRYVGPETPELLEDIRQHRRARADERTRRSLVSKFVRSGGLLVRFPGLVRRWQPWQGQALHLRDVLVGAVAYQTYPALLGAHLPSASMMTSDIAQFSNVSVAVSDTTAPMIEVLKTVDDSFRAVPHLHDGQRSVTYRASNGLRVDFLTSNEDRTPTGRSASRQSVPTPSPIASWFFSFMNPNPRSFCTEVESTSRSLRPNGTPCTSALSRSAGLGRANAKRPKYLAQSEALLNRLVEQRPNELRDVWREARNRSPKWAAYTQAGLAGIDPRIRDRTLTVI